ncbi:MAG: hypothetical protein EBX41_07590 [Chitinophagia bacterium]|nr:hypothetical protein [Chitinophagia bacterium]
MCKDGFSNEVQRYKCGVCGVRFTVGIRLEASKIWLEYTSGKQTYAELAAKYGCSVKTIQRKIDSVQTERQTTFLSVANVVMDTTYFGRKLGVMVFKDSLTGTILLKQYV